jgi:crossover junction endodeoxyribonuclease RusA
MAGRPHLPGGVAVHLDFVLPRPKSTPKTQTPPAVKRPDLDKLIRACLDAITGICIGDDSQVVAIVASKRLAEVGETPGVGVDIRSTNGRCYA